MIPLDIVSNILYILVFFPVGQSWVFTWPKYLVYEEGVVAQWVKLSLGMPTFQVRVPIGVLAILLWIQLPAGTQSKAAADGSGTCVPAVHAGDLDGFLAPGLGLAQLQL